MHEWNGYILIRRTPFANTAKDDKKLANNGTFAVSVKGKEENEKILKNNVMGSMKEEWMQRQEDERNEKLATFLGITYDELQETNWELNENTSDDGLVYGLIIKFDEDNSAPEILKKIKRLDENNTVSFDPNELENYQELDEEELGGEG